VITTPQAAPVIAGSRLRGTRNNGTA